MFILLDIGATNTRIALANKNKILKIIEFPTQRNFKKELAIIADIFYGFEKRASSAVCGFAGGFKNGGVIKTSPNLKSWVGKNLQAGLENIFKTKIEIKNDAYLGTLGEKYFGSARNLNDFYFLTIGSGIGGAMFINGQIFYCEPGHQIIINQRNWSCRQQSCLESFVSGRAIKKFYRTEPKFFKNKKIWLKINEFLAKGILNISQITGIKTIILSGSMIKSGLELKLIQGFLKRQAGIFEAPKILKSKLMDQATLYGCLFLAKQR